MLTYLKERKEKFIIDVLIQNNDKKIYRLKNNKIFKTISRKQFFIKQPPRPIFFSILKFWRIFHANKNLVINKKIHNSLKKNSFNIDNYSEIYFSNESVSNYLLFNSNIKKIYFDHSPIDTMLNINLNLLKKLKKFIECYVNNEIMNIYYKGNGNFQQKSIFANFLKKKNLRYQLSVNKFKNIFDHFNREKLIFQSKSVYNLINFYIPYYAFDSKYSKKILENYVIFFIDQIFYKILPLTGKNDIFLFKFRQNIPFHFQLTVMRHIKKKFPKKKLILINKEFPKMINLEKIISNFNIKRYFTSPSSSIFLAKVLNSQVTVYDYGQQWSNFLKKNWALFKHKDNFNNYLLASKLYKNVSKKL